MAELLKLLGQADRVISRLLAHFSDINENTHAKLLDERVPLDQDFTFVFCRVQNVRLGRMVQWRFLVQKVRIVLCVEQRLTNDQRVRVVLKLGCLLLVHGGTCSKAQLRLILLT